MFKSLKIFSQIFIITVAIFLTGFSAFILIALGDAFEYNSKLDSNLKDEVTNTVMRIAASDLETIGNLTISHAYWTDFLAHTEARDVAWIRENATEYLFLDKSYGVDNLYLVNDKNGFTEHYGNLPQTLYLQMAEAASVDELLQGYVSFLASYDGALDF